MTDTKTRILDAAETLMLQHGADRTSLRMITTRADVNLAAINYHFGSKENLVDAVLARYIGPIIDSQLALLEKAEAAAGKNGPPLNDIIRGYLIPLIAFVERNPHHCEVFTKILRPLKDVDRFQNWVAELQKPLTARFGEALLRVLPDVPRETVLVRMALMMSTASVFFHAWQLEDVERVYSISVSKEKLLQHTVAFISAGFQGNAVCPG
ncbi:MAG: TetR/AcrR family transcriptional regulator [Desulfobacterales bacterium]|nr:TetR/AcrR family transcriptional regulator [Desulfobacterales bacterium]MDD4073099.1 TetR/AcrR family transcriptional regulator [Desulfobacterales bacterium]MDD4393099.1 TetR/AcrR family transcriptional regulator [Desulfobacterales bacterium]